MNLPGEDDSELTKRNEQSETRRPGEWPDGLHIDDFDTLNPPTPSKAPFVRVLQFRRYENHQLSILELFLLTTITAISLVVVTQLSLFGALALFVICCCVTLMGFSYEGEGITNPVRFRFWNQFMWGILMPMACIFADPFVFGEFEGGQPRYLNEYAIGGYAFVGWQMLIMALSFVIRPGSWMNDFIAGTFFAGATFAGIVAILMLPLTLIGTLLMFIGLLGLTPWLTAMTYLKSGLFHIHRKKSVSEAKPILAIVGYIVAFAIGLTGLTIPQLL